MKELYETMVMLVYMDPMEKRYVCTCQAAQMTAEGVLQELLNERIRDLEIDDSGF